jgi:hypothetical protein
MFSVFYGFLCFCGFMCFLVVFLFFLGLASWQSHFIFLLTSPSNKIDYFGKNKLLDPSNKIDYLAKISY